jgi:hypothetical protein
MERPIGTDVADPQRGELGQAEPGVEQHKRERPLSLVGKGEEAPQLRIGEGGDEPARHLRSPQRSEATRSCDLFGGAPVAEGLEAPDVAGDRLGRQRATQFKEPCPQLGRWDGVDRPRLAEPSDSPDEDHPVPLDRPGRRALGRLGGAEQVGRGAEPDRNRAKRIKRTAGWAQRVRRTNRGRVRCLTARPLASGRPDFTFTGRFFDLRSAASRRLNPGVSGEHPRKSQAH